MNTSSFNSISLNSFSDPVNSISNFTQSVRQTDFTSSYSLFIGLFIVVIISLLVAWMLYWIISTKLFLNVKHVVEETKIPVVCTSKRTFAFDIKKTGNGERRSYTFWIYIHDMNKYSGSYKNVFYVSGESSNEKEFVVDTASPYAFLDQFNNMLYFRFNTGNKDDDRRPVSKRENISKFMKSGITIPYVPLQRWVHIAVVCNANSYKNYIYAYVDGDMVNSTSTDENDKFIVTTQPERKDLKNMEINKSGYIHIGGDASTISGNGFSGLVSNIKTFNYELNQQDIYNDYYGGPIGNILAKIGLGMYGIRNPIYKL
jgi:hypothetical protein